MSEILNEQFEINLELKKYLKQKFPLLLLLLLLLFEK
jgi:hypothetical protein